MKMHIDFDKGIEPVDFEVNVLKATPLELVVEDKGSYRSQADSLSHYVQSLDFLFRGVINNSAGRISAMHLEKNGFGRLMKQGLVLDWNLVTDKSFVVVYSLSRDSISENMYVADGMVVGGKNNAKGAEPLWIKEMLEPAHGDILKNHIIHTISIVSEYVTKYRLVWDYKGRPGLTVLTRSGNIVSVDDIKDDESFMLIKLLTLLISKGVHLGVFLINAHKISERTLKALTETARLFFGDTFMFIYNLPEESTLERNTVLLPNFRA